MKTNNSGNISVTFSKIAAKSKVRKSIPLVLEKAKRLEVDKDKYVKCKGHKDDFREAQDNWDVLWAEMLAERPQMPTAISDSAALRASC